MGLIASRHLTNDKGGGAASFNTASITPYASELILITVTQDYDTAITPNEPTVTGCNLTWVKVITQLNDPDNHQRITVFRAMGDSPTAGQLTIACGGQSQQSIMWGVTAFSPVNRSGTDGSGSVVQSSSNSRPQEDPGSMTLTLSAFGNTKNATYAAIIAPDAISTPSGFTALFQDSQDLGPDNTFKAVFKNSPDSAFNFTWTGSGARVATGIALEIRQKSAGGGFL